MAVLSILVSLMVFLPQTSDQSFAPMYVIFDDLGGTPEQKLDHLLLLNEFLPDGFVVPIDDALIARLSNGNDFVKFNDPPKFMPTGGMLYMLNQRGEQGQVRFRTVNTPEVFDEFLKGHAAKRGSAVQVTRAGNNVLMTVPGPGEQRPSGATVKWMDSHFSYGNGIVTWGSNAFSTPFDQLSGIVEKSAGYDWCFYARPTKIPESYKSKFLQAIWLHSAVALQKRDAETDGDYTTRRSLSDLRIELTQRVFADIEEVWAGKRSGDLTAGFHGHVSLAIRPDSELSQLVRQLSRGGAFTYARPENPLWSTAINIGIPEQVKSLLHATLKNSQWSETLAAKAISRQIDRGAIAGGLASLTESDGQIRVNGMIECDATDDEIEALLNPLGARRDVDGSTRIQFPAMKPDELLGNFHLRVRAEPDLERVAIESYRGDVKESPVEDTPSKESADVPDRVWVELVKVTADLRSLGELQPESEVKRLFVKCEQLYHESVAQPYRERYRMVQEPLDDEFISIASKIRSDGNWKLDLVVRALPNGERIVADLSLGRELYGLLLARKHTSLLTVPRLKVGPKR